MTNKWDAHICSDVLGCYFERKTTLFFVDVGWRGLLQFSAIQRKGPYLHSLGWWVYKLGITLWPVVSTVQACGSSGLTSG